MEVHTRKTIYQKREIAILIPIRKGGYTTHCGNYRRITLPLACEAHTGSKVKQNYNKIINLFQIYKHLKTGMYLSVNNKIFSE